MLFCYVISKPLFNSLGAIFLVLVAKYMYQKNVQGLLIHVVTFFVIAKRK